VQIGLRLCATLGNEVLQAIEQAALRAVRRVVEIMEIEGRAVIAGQGHAAGQIAVRRADHLVHHPVQGHDAQAEIVD
jgi:hypothetical protein